MTISSELVKQLRDRTGAGIMDCKQALAESAGDMEAAIDWLRKKGLAAASKKASRTASEGLVGMVATDSLGVLVEVNAETDFVARNDAFQNFVASLARLALDTEVSDVASLLAAPYPNTKHAVADEVTALVARIGENISLRRLAKLTAPSPNGSIASYMHNVVADNAGVDKNVVLGKIGVLLALSGGEAALGKQLAMHVAAAAPLALDEAGVDKALLDRERALYRDQAIQSGKPAEIADKMVVGRMKKFLAEVALLQQTFVIDGETKIADVLSKSGGAAITGFSRFQLGEGIEKAATDFAAEVTAQLGSQT